MTKKHFIAIASIIRNHEARKSAEIVTLTYRLADEFAVINPNFNRGIFLEACGMEF